MASHGGRRARFQVRRAGVASLGAEEAALPAVGDIPSPRQQRRLRQGCSPGRAGEGPAAGPPGSPKQLEGLGGGGEVLQPRDGS